MEIDKNTPALYYDKPSRIIIELTNICNLDCDMCLRRSWSEFPGNMSKEVFSKLISDLSNYSSLPEIFFGGYGEPLSHPDILDMIRHITSTGSKSALITNGTLLSPHLAESLVDAGLSKLWISLDSSHQDALHQAQATGIHPSTHDLLAELSQKEDGVISKLSPGLAMVLTKNNQIEIMDLVKKGQKLGLNSFFITNLEAYSIELAGVLPYSLKNLRQPRSWQTGNSDLIEVLENLSTNNPEVSIEGPVINPRSKCPFAEKGDLVLRWDGEISPCLPLLYDRTTYFESWEHKQISYSIGNILDRSISEIWEDRDFSGLRARLLNNDFSPCLGCRDCWFSDDNLQDCMGFEHPTCGGCLWAEGLISCP
jgi:MoaA/NifB/PqqE/SkfB family radical SAM enzyme